MYILSTGFQLILLCFGLYAAWVALEEARSVKGLRQRLEQLELDADLLGVQFKKLSGRFYAARGKETPTIEVAAGPATSLPVCEQYLLAQTAGPGSSAAQCVCDYCESKRAERARARSLLVPKTAKAQGELARKNAATP